MDPVRVAAVQAAYLLMDIFRLCVDTSPRPAVTETPLDHLRSPS